MLTIWMKIGRQIVNMHMCAQIGSFRSSHLFVVHNRAFRYQTYELISIPPAGKHHSHTIEWRTKTKLAESDGFT